MMKQQWFLVQFKPNSSKLAERNLRRQGFKTFLPLQEATRRKASKFVNYLKPFFPGYMFIFIDGNSAPWKNINNTLGVSRLVTFGNILRPVPKELILELKKRTDPNGKISPPKIMRPGERVEFSRGPFASLIATIETIDIEKRIWVVMELMGQTTRVKVNTEQVKKVVNTLE